MKNFSDLLEMAKVSDIISNKDKDDNKIVWVLRSLVRLQQ